jgi:hypothetical protein
LSSLSCNAIPYTFKKDELAINLSAGELSQVNPERILVESPILQHEIIEEPVIQNVVPINESLQSEFIANNDDSLLQSNIQVSLSESFQQVNFLNVNYALQQF